MCQSTEKVHFGRFDTRFCGSIEQGRRFALDAAEITCPHCKENNRFEAYSRSLEDRQ